MNTSPVEQATILKQNNKLPLTGDPLLEPLVRQLAAEAMTSPRALDLLYEYVELIRRKGKRYNRFRSSIDKKLLVTLMFCAEEMKDGFKIAEARANAFLAAHKHLKREPEDIHRSRIIEASQSSNKGVKAMTRIILALADRAYRFGQSGARQYNRQPQLPVSPRHPYVILEVDEMLQHAAWQKM